MLTSRGTLRICVVGVGLSVSVIIARDFACLIPLTPLALFVSSGVVQTIAEGCLASFIATFFVTLQTYRNDKLAYLRQTYSGLKLVYTTINPLANYMGIMRTVVCNAEISSHLAGFRGVHYGDLESAEGLQAYRKDMVADEVVFHKLMDAATYLSSYLGELVKGAAYVKTLNLGYRGKLRKEMTAYSNELEGFTVLLSELVSKCRRVYSEYTAVRQTPEELASALRTLREAIPEVGTTCGECLSSGLDLRNQTNTLILSIEAELGKYATGSWAQERKASDAVASCDIAEKSRRLK